MEKRRSKKNRICSVSFKVGLLLVIGGVGKVLVEYTLFGVKDKVQEAINLLKEKEPEDGYYLAFSGGKDSVVIYDLAKKANVKFEAYHNIVTIEPPEVMKFIYKEYPEVKMLHTKKTMYQLFIENGFPPMRQMRYCHRQLKCGGEDKIKITGVRAEESALRASKPKFEKARNGKGYLLHLIHDWTTGDVWNYIKDNNVKYCSLYDEGRKRIGCLFCPFAGQQQINEDLKRYPQVAEYLIKACNRIIENKKAAGKKVNFTDGAELFYWWINHNRGKKAADRYLKGLFDEEDFNE